MSRVSVIVPFLCAASVMAADNVLTPEEVAAGWTLLFNGHDIDEWSSHTSFETHPKWEVLDGVLRGSQAAGYLMRPEIFADFELVLDVRIHDTGKHRGNSGIYFRCQPHDDQSVEFPPGYEMQVDHGDANNPTGSIYNLIRAKKPPTKDGEWINMHLKAVGNHFVIHVNGQTVVDAVDPLNRYRSGYFMLQQHHATGVVEFKNIRVRKLNSSDSFRLHDSRQLRLDWLGAPLITEDDLRPTGGFGNADDTAVAPLTNGKAVNVHRTTGDDFRYRREAAVHDNMAEITMRFRTRPYAEEGHRGGTYMFRVPAERLEGFEFCAVTGRSYQKKIVQGRVSADMPDGMIASGMAYLTLRGPAGGLTFDFAPQGRGLVYNVESDALPGNAWTLRKEGRFFIFATGLSARWYGGMLTAKVVILPKVHQYETLHPAPDEWHYGCVPQTTLALAFYEDAPKGFTAMGTEAWDNERRAGWAYAKDLSLSPAILGRMATGKKASLRLMTIPGYYLVTIRFGTDKPLGPFALKANAKPIVADLRAGAGEVESFTFPIRLLDGALRLDFEADERFGISAVLLQRLLTPYEERFTFTQPLWLGEGIPTPDQSGPADPAPAAPPRPAPGDGDWRWNMAMVNFGPHNSSSCLQVDSRDVVERRLREIKAEGYNTIISNGLHFRLCHLDKWPAIERTTRLLCDVAHQHGIRVIEHHDVPIPLAHGQGYRVLIEHPDWLQRDIVTGKVATMFCVANPDFRRWYCAWFRDYARATGIDGAMLDEVRFFGPTFCGCRHCRADFARRSEKTLPHRGKDTAFMNTSDPLWVAWEKRRIEAATDFFKGIREAFDEVSPAASLMTYTTHSGFSTSYGSRNFGGDLVDRARVHDFLGTEIMSRNVFDSYRPVFAFRKAKSALTHRFDRPIFGLVYHLDDPHIAYFGWALLHMNRQVPWLSSIEGFDLGRFVNWKDRMDIKAARPLSDVAVIFSRTCCNYNRASSHVSDALGCSEVLSDAHIQHDFLLDLDLRGDVLRRYRVVLLPSVECLSRDQVRELENYVGDGGRLIVTGWTSQCDEYGTREKDFRLADLAGVHLDGKLMSKPVRLKAGDNSPVELKASATRIRANESATVLARFVDGEGSPVAPALVETAAGEGRCFYSALRLGEINYDRELTAGDKYQFVLNESARDMLLGLVRRAVQHPLTVEAVGVPEKVLLSAYRQPDGYAVHLLNATGVRLKPGDTIPRKKTGDVFPTLNDDLVFDLRVPGISGGRIVSPDFPDAHSIETKRVDGAYRVTVPAAALKAYGIVYLDE